MTNCAICGRELTDKKSIKRGFGPVCYKKYLDEKAKDEFEKKQIDLIGDNKK